MDAGRRRRRRRARGRSPASARRRSGPARARGRRAAGPDRRHSAAARFRSCVDSTIVDAAVAIQRGEQQLHVELIAEVERRRRLVEQQQLGALRQRAGDDDALLLAAAERGERARFERRRAGRVRAPAARSRDPAGPSSAKAPRCGKRPISTMSSTVKSNGACVSCGTSAMRRASSRRVQSASGRPSNGPMPGWRRQRAAQHLEQRRLARSVRAEDADELAAARSSATRRRRRAARRRDRRSETLSGLQHQRVLSGLRTSIDVTRSSAWQPTAQHVLRRARRQSAS